MVIRYRGRTFFIIWFCLLSCAISVTSLKHGSNSQRFKQLNKEYLTAAINKAFPPEMFAAAYGDEPHLDYLLSRWEKPSDGANVKDWVEQTPLHLAAKFGKLETAKLLLENGANVNARSRDFYETPLHLASKSGYAEMIRLLVEHGADANARAASLTIPFFFGGTPIIYATDIANSLDAVVSLVHFGRANVNTQNFEGMTPLHFAVKNQNLALVEFLLDSGANIEASDKTGRSPLNYLVSENIKPQLSMIGYLLRRGANVESRDIFGRTPLQADVVRNNRAVAKYLIQQGADINSEALTGRTVLHRLVVTKELRNVDLIRFVLNQGASANTSGCNMPLYDFANMSRNEYDGEKRSSIVNIARLLISKGADPFYKDPCTGKSPLDLALNNKYVHLVEVFQYYSSKFEDLTDFSEEESASEMPLAVTFANNIGIAKLEDIVAILSNMPKELLQGRDWLNQTALHVATFFGRSFDAMVLAYFGYDIHAKDGSGRTPLHNSARLGNTLLSNYFLDRGANIEVSDNDGMTPLLLAVKFSSFISALYLLDPKDKQ